MIDGNRGVMLAQGFKTVGQQHIGKSQIGPQIQRHPQIENGNIGALAVGERRGDPEQRLGSAICGCADQAFRLLVCGDTRQAGTNHGGQPAIAEMRTVEQFGGLAPAIAFQKTAICFQHTRRRRRRCHRFFIGGFGGFGFAQIVLQKRGMEGCHVFSTLLLGQLLQVFSNAGIVAQRRRRPGIEQRQGQGRERPLGRLRQLPAHIGIIIALESYDGQRQPRGTVVGRGGHHGLRILSRGFEIAGGAGIVEGQRQQRLIGGVVRQRLAVIARRPGQVMLGGREAG